MQEVYDAEYVSLHVRVGNRAAFTLYSHTLGYQINDIEAKYYADGEDAYDMRRNFPKIKKESAQAAESEKKPQENTDENKKDPSVNAEEVKGTKDEVKVDKKKRNRKKKK
jgi:hypothetical protein